MDGEHLNRQRNCAMVVLGQCLNSNATPSAILVSRMEACVALLLTGGTTKTTTRSNDRTGNKSTSAGGCRFLILTGGDASKVGVTEAQVMKDLYDQILDAKLKSTSDTTTPATSEETRREYPEEIILEESSLTTVWNALFCLPLLRYKRVNVVHLVTSDFHMPRALMIFESILLQHHRQANDGIIEVIPHPVPIPIPYQHDDDVNGLAPCARVELEYNMLNDDQNQQARSLMAYHVLHQARGLDIPPIPKSRVEQAHREIQSVMEKFRR